MTSLDSGVSDLGAEIGARVRRHRKAAGLSGVKLASAADVSQSFLSQLESGQTSVAIATLYRLAEALGVHPADLLPQPTQLDYQVVRSGDREHMVMSDHVRAASARAIFRSRSQIAEFYDYDIKPEDHVEDWFSSRSEHVLYVLEGRLRFEFEGRPEIHLAAGDALFYNSQVPHRWLTFSDEGARIILVSVDRSVEE